jgi:hypothetical protein
MNRNSSLLRHKKDSTIKYITSLCVLLLLVGSIIITTCSSGFERGLLGVRRSLALGMRDLLGLGEGLVHLVHGALLSLGVLSNRGVHLLEQLLQAITIDVGLDVLGEVLLVFLVIILLHLLHVVTDVLSHNSSNVAFGIESLGVLRESGEALVVVRDIQAAVAGALQSAEHTGTGGGVLDTNIEQGTEWSLFLINLLKVVGAAIDLGGGHISRRLLIAGIHLIKIQLLQQSAGEQQASAVGSGVVLQTAGEAVSNKLLGVSGAQNLVTDNLSIYDLAQNISVREADNKTVLGGFVLVLVLGDQLVALAVIGLALCRNTLISPQKMNQLTTNLSACGT